MGNYSNLLYSDQAGKFSRRAQAILRSSVKRILAVSTSLISTIKRLSKSNNLVGFSLQDYQLFPDLQNKSFLIF